MRNKPWLSANILKLIKVNRELKKSKKQYYAEYFVSSINNMKKTWEIVNLKKKPTKTTQLNIGGKTIDDDKEVATTFNDFFVNVYVRKIIYYFVTNSEKTILLFMVWHKSER